MSIATQEINPKNMDLIALIQQVEAGNHIVLTRNGSRVARLIPEMPAKKTKEERRAILEKFQREASSKIVRDTDAAHSQDFLYDENGLPA